MFKKNNDAIDQFKQRYVEHTVKEEKNQMGSVVVNLGCASSLFIVPSILTSSPIVSLVCVNISVVMIAGLSALHDKKAQKRKNDFAQLLLTDKLKKEVFLLWGAHRSHLSENVDKNFYELLSNWERGQLPEMARLYLLIEQLEQEKVSYTQKPDIDAYIAQHNKVYGTDFKEDGHSKYAKWM